MIKVDHESRISPTEDKINRLACQPMTPTRSCQCARNTTEEANARTDG